MDSVADSSPPSPRPRPPRAPALGPALSALMVTAAVVRVVESMAENTTSRPPWGRYQVGWSNRETRRLRAAIGDFPDLRIVPPTLHCARMPEARIRFQDRGQSPWNRTPG